MSLTNLALSGLNAAQNRLQTTGHNISNAATEGFNRQSVFVETAGAQATSAGYVGRGAQAVTVYRAYDHFINKQLVQAETSLASAKTYQSEVMQVNNLFADRTTGVSPALQKFFEGVNAVASAPGDAAARQEMLGRANSLVTQVKDTQAFLDQQRGNVNTQITTMVSRVNSMVERINDLNNQVVFAKASASPHPPNDLLDQRDQLVKELSQTVNVTVFEQDNVFNLAIGNGETILGAGRVFPLAAMPSGDDPSRLVLGIGGQGSARELSESSIRGGSLGGLIQYRAEILDAVQNDLGRLAVGLTETFNELHSQGANLGDSAKTPAVASNSKFFSIEIGKAIPASGTPDSVNVPTVSVSDPSGLKPNDYRISYNGASASYEIRSLPGNNLTTFVPDTSASPPVTAVEVDGLTFDFSTVAPTVSDGNAWVIQPMRNAASRLAVEIQQPNDIAVAMPGTGSANGDIGLKLAQLQTDKVLGNGSMSLNEAFSQIVNKVGVLTQQNSTTVIAQTALVQQNYAAQQGISGVNLNEEYVNLDRFQEQFRAASRLIDVSSKLFDVLMSLRV